MIVGEVAISFFGRENNRTFKTNDKVTRINTNAKAKKLLSRKSRRGGKVKEKDPKWWG